LASEFYNVNPAGSINDDGSDVTGGTGIEFFDNDGDDNIFKATFGSSFGSLSFGNVAQTGLPRELLLDDLSVIGSLAGGGDLGDMDLIYVPESSALALTGFGLLAVLLQSGKSKLRYGVW
jgi:hypothetical protein